MNLLPQAHINKTKILILFLYTTWNLFKFTRSGKILTNQELISIYKFLITHALQYLIKYSLPSGLWAEVCMKLRINQASGVEESCRFNRTV